MKGSKVFATFLLFLIIGRITGQEKIPNWSIGLSRGILNYNYQANVLWNDLNLIKPIVGGIMNGAGYAFYKDEITRAITTLEFDKYFLIKKNTISLGLGIGNYQTTRIKLNDREVFYQNNLTNPLGNGAYELVNTYEFNRNLMVDNPNSSMNLVSLKLGYSRSFKGDFSAKFNVSTFLNAANIYPSQIGISKTFKKTMTIECLYTSYSLLKSSTEIFGTTSESENLRFQNGNPIGYPTRFTSLPAFKSLKEGNNAYAFQIGVKYIFQQTKKEKKKKEITPKSTQF